MKQSLLFILPVAALMAASFACSKSADVHTGEGTLSLQLQPVVDIVEQTKGEVGDYATVPSASDFKLTILNYASAVAWEGMFSEFDPQTLFVVGDYTATVEYGDPEEEGVAKPCFKASETYTIVELENTPVTLNPTLANCIVKVEAGDYLKKYYSSISFSLTSAAGAKFAMEEGTSVFIDAYKFTLDATFTMADGSKTVFSKTFDSLEAAHCYTVGVELDNVAGNSFTITFNDSVETVKIEEDLN